MRWHRELETGHHWFVVGNRQENFGFHHKNTGKHQVEEIFSSSGFRGPTSLQLEHGSSPSQLFLLENFNHLR